jgi:hypothetical protein
MNKSKIFALFAITMLVMLVLVEDTEAQGANKKAGILNLTFV